MVCAHQLSDASSHKLIRTHDIYVRLEQTPITALHTMHNLHLSITVMHIIEGVLQFSRNVVGLWPNKGHILRSRPRSYMHDLCLVQLRVLGATLSGRLHVGRTR